MPTSARFWLSDTRHADVGIRAPFLNAPCQLCQGGFKQVSRTGRGRLVPYLFSARLQVERHAPQRTHRARALLAFVADIL